MASTGAVQADLPITTAQELPGVQVAESLGLCFGLIVRSMGFAKGFTASFSALRSGEVSQYTEVLEDSRRHCRVCLKAQVPGRPLTCRCRQELAANAGASPLPESGNLQ